VFYRPVFVRVKDRSHGRRAVQIVEAVRDGARVCQRVIKHVGVAADVAQLEGYRSLAHTLIDQLQQQPRLPLRFSGEADAVTRCQVGVEERVRVKHLREQRRIVEGIREVFGRVYDELGLREAISGGRRDAQWNEVLKACVLARLASPVSKRESVALLGRDHGIEIRLERVYRMMNHVAANEERIKDLACRQTLLFRQTVDVLFFDVTTLYFESVESDEVRAFGFSKDCKFYQTQVMLALVTTTDGMPITYELFPGNTSEGNTLVTMVADLKRRFDVRQVLLVADRAMFSEKNLAYMDAEGVSYIVAAKLRKLPANRREAILRATDFRAAAVEDELHWIREFETGNPDRRLIVGYSSARARKDAADRKRLVDRIRRKADGEGRLPVSDLVTNRGDRRFLLIEKARARINESKIDADAQWDGLHGVITNARDLPAEDAIRRYRGLWQIEAAFRLNKSDLAMRPVYHWTPKRIRAHVAICYLAYVVAKHTMGRARAHGITMSFESLRAEILRVQASVLRDVSTRKHYRLPSHLTAEQRAIYRALGLRRTEQVQILPTYQL
jgi:hypothetical protein